MLREQNRGAEPALPPGDAEELPASGPWPVTDEVLSPSYFHGVGRFPVLTREQEQEVAQRAGATTAAGKLSALELG